MFKINYLSKLFKDDLSINNDTYGNSILKGFFLFILFCIVYDLSDNSNKGWFFLWISIFTLLISIWISKKLNFHFLKFKMLSKKDFLIVLIGYVSVFILDNLYEIIRPSIPPNDQPIISEYAGSPFIILVFSLAIAPAIIEEFVVRGILFRVVFRGHLIIGLLVSSIVFSLLHDGDSFIDYIPYFYFAVIVGVCFLITKRLEVAILIHFLNNFITVLEYFA
ncbi:TPA: CPBP family intramembrane glutamic endopeptidase [Staphylococcus aureus]